MAVAKTKEVKKEKPKAEPKATLADVCNQAELEMYPDLCAERLKAKNGK